MSRSLRGRESADVPSVVVECDPADVDGSTRVRDLDQLPPAGRDAFIDALDGTSARAGDIPGITTGDVVRFTEYYRVV
jgi:hypothetical protein